SSPFHNPFDISSYPITNPPLLDSTMMIPYYSSDGVPRRRRISISNGQIGQIINHEALFESELMGFDDPAYPYHPSQGQPHSTGTPVNERDSAREADSSITDAAGVPPPNHQLIYNNEVIYNPNNGPIPGTAAWKKERLLERNRIAASKCRQRKKQAQLQLQNNVTKYEQRLVEAQRKLGNCEKLIALMNSHIDEYFTK
ncbi:uncharacterized protein CANTADRAFT_32986, partial [Suhomyces tanzawaensis NRRL Y-17324]